jgi:hypothetical protein
MFLHALLLWLFVLCAAAWFFRDVFVTSVKKMFAALSMMKTSLPATFKAFQFILYLIGIVRMNRLYDR